MATEVYKPERVRKITDSEASPGISLEVKRDKLILTQYKGSLSMPLKEVHGFAREMCDMAEVHGKGLRT